MLGGTFIFSGVQRPRRIARRILHVYHVFAALNAAGAVWLLVRRTPTWLDWILAAIAVTIAVVILCSQEYRWTRQVAGATRRRSRRRMIELPPQEELQEWSRTTPNVGTRLSF